MTTSICGRSTRSSAFPVFRVCPERRALACVGMRQGEGTLEIGLRMPDGSQVKGAHERNDIFSCTSPQNQVFKAGNIQVNFQRVHRWLAWRWLPCRVPGPKQRCLGTSTFAWRSPRRLWNSFCAGIMLADVCGCLFWKGFGQR